MSNLMEMENSKLFDSHKDNLVSMIREGARLVSTGSQGKPSMDGRRKSSLLTKIFKKG